MRVTIETNPLLWFKRKQKVPLPDSSFFCSYCGKHLRSNYAMSLGIDSERTAQCDRLMCQVLTGHWWWRHVR